MLEESGFALKDYSVEERWVVAAIFPCCFLAVLPTDWVVWRIDGLPGEPYSVDSEDSFSDWG